MTSSRLTRYTAIIALSLSMTLPAVAAEQTVPTSQQVKDVYPGLASGALSSARLADLPAGVLLRSGDVTIAQKDLDADIAKAPAEMRTQIKNNGFFLLENRASRQLLTAEAKAWAKQAGRAPDKDDNALLQAYFEDLTSKITISDDEIRVFYFDNKDMMGGATFDQVKDQLNDYLLSQKRDKAVDAHILTLGDRAAIEVSKTWTARQYIVAMNNPVDKARKSGKPTMVDFGADGCQPCEMMTPILAALKKEYSGKVNVLFVHVRKEQILGARYGVSSIPVQVFYDKSGKEVFRHVGFFPKAQIAAKLAEMGVK
jgi:thiol-disulfide isomerase/thioredoxin